MSTYTPLKYVSDGCLPVASIAIIAHAELLAPEMPRGYSKAVPVNTINPLAKTILHMFLPRKEG